MVGMMLRLVTAAGLAVDAFVHWNLAAQFDPLVGSGPVQVSEGQLFRLEALLALVAALLVLLVRRRWTVLVAFVVALAGVAAVLLYRYVDIGAVGPLPDMFDPTWYPQKTLSLVAEVVASVAAGTLLLRVRPQRGTPPAGASRTSAPPPPGLSRQ
ncbi:hypothetical protein [Oryzihumus leptocrescens]|uniref:Uncharacterized protein n=1 Tax=Oryzihumus leptocrescens TaxID=297536 RepID=A0A542ZL33_9MICO|nr:hypothetical protein [Oryzihumus leptocrescens]TQL61061.1 hypothetical protein FB474_2466 [Oryzihumus leptocrescens]